MSFKHSKTTRIFLNAYPLSGYCARAEVGMNPGLSDVTTFSDTGMKGLRGVSDDTFTIETLYDDDAAGPDVAIAAALGVDSVLSIYPGGDAIGLAGYSGGTALVAENAMVSAVGEIVKASVRGSFNQRADRLKSLGTEATATATTNGTTIDDAAASAVGLVWAYHVSAWSASGGNARWQILLEDSANGSSWATLLTETYNITAVGAARKATSITGAIRRYVRLTVTRDATSGSITYQAGYQRL